MENGVEHKPTPPTIEGNEGLREKKIGVDEAEDKKRGLREKKIGVDEGEDEND